MTNYNEMSDFEINMDVAEALLKSQPECEFRRPTDLIGEILGLESQALEIVTPMGSVQHFDGCNNPSDAWPIIVENAITLNAPNVWLGNNDKWMASVDQNRIVNDGVRCWVHDDSNPLRAAMIVYLMMQEADND